MTVNIAFSRPVGAVLVVLGITFLGAGTMAVELMNRAALVEERDAKGAYVARSLAIQRPHPAGNAIGAMHEDLTLAADSATLAAAQIDTLVRSTVVAAGGTVLSSRAETKAEDPVGERTRRIEVQAAVQGRIEALQASLFHLESGRPLIMVDQMSIRSADESDAGRNDAQAPVLVATLTLSAFWAPRHP